MSFWDKFILAGFGGNIRERRHAEQEAIKYGAVIEAKDDDLELKWYTKEQLRYYTVVCRCGNNRMLYHENGIRCHLCGRFHSHDNFQKKSAQAKQAAKFHSGKIAQIPQPYERKMGVQPGSLLKGRGPTKTE